VNPGFCFCFHPVRPFPFFSGDPDRDLPRQGIKIRLFSRLFLFQDLFSDWAVPADGKTVPKGVISQQTFEIFALPAAQVAFSASFSGNLQISRLVRAENDFPGREPEIPLAGR
jgi:hypothetical protein